MKTLILYATKYGAAREIARRIAGEMDTSAIYDLKQGELPALSDFDCVIVGSSLYAGMIRKDAKAFLAKNAGALRDKRLGLFLSGMDADAARINGYFASNFPAELLGAAKVTASPGGIYNPKKAGFWERAIFKLAAKQADYADSIDNDKIAEFAKALKGTGNETL